MRDTLTHHLLGNRTVSRARENCGCPLMTSKPHNLHDSRVGVQRGLWSHASLDGACTFLPRSQVIGRSGMGDHTDTTSSRRAAEQPL